MPLVVSNKITTIWKARPKLGSINLRNLFLFFMGTLIVSLSGCASVPMATSEQDAKAKDFSTLPDKGSVFIFNNTTLETDAQLVSVNGKIVGSTTANTYLRFNLIPGNYTINAYAGYGNPMIVLKVEPGTNYFVKEDFGIPFTLEKRNETDGRKAVLESKLVASTITDDEVSATVSSSNNASSVSQKLRDLQSLRKDGVITDDEYEIKKKELLKSF